jgi:hypothetical protein
MARTLLIRTASAAALLSLSFLLVALIPFLSTDWGDASGVGRTPAVSVNREFKGDRLPLPSELNSAISRSEPQQRQSKPARHIPVGCDGAFSPISAPELAHVYGRCAT